MGTNICEWGTATALFENGAYGGKIFGAPVWLCQERHSYYGGDHQAYFCPRCGEIWGRLVIDLPRSPVQQMWRVIQVPCAEHGGGSFLARNRDFLYADTITRELLLRELYLEDTL